jgi:VWFA-related protein
MRVRVAVALVTLVISARALSSQSTTSTSAQDAPPVFRSGVESVRFDAFVTDDDGNPVADLTIDDFEVFEDGRPQKVQQFSRVLLPPRGSSRREQRAGPPADVSVNDQGQDRIYVIVYDRMTWPQAVSATQMVRTFLDGYFEPSDLVSLVTLDRQGPLRFTNDPMVLLREADEFVRRYADARLLPFADSRMRERVVGYTQQDTLARARIFGDIARSLDHIEARRKSVLFISDGLGFDPFDAIDTPKSSFSEAARAALAPSWPATSRSIRSIPASRAR